jgi:transaldolase
MRKSNIKDYRAFAIDVIKIVKSRPVSFEVFSDEFEIMEK